MMGYIHLDAFIISYEGKFYIIKVTNRESETANKYSC